MAADEVNVATAALAIASVALLIALGQLLHQLFGGADGYRKCQNSVIGGWAKLVRLRFRWLEVRVTTPHLEIHPFYVQDENVQDENVQDENVQDENVQDEKEPMLVRLDGSKHAQDLTFTREPGGTNNREDEDMVSWTSLLVALHDRQRFQLSSIRSGDYTLPKPRPTLQKPRNQLLEITIVYARRKTRSWDLMPPDVVRPLASTNLGTLVSIAHRLGMVWVDFVPGEGRIRAEGPGLSISATLMRGMGIVVEFNIEYGSRSAHVELMAFGILPGNEELHTWDLHLRSIKFNPDAGFMLQAADEILRKGWLKKGKHYFEAVHAIQYKASSLNDRELAEFWSAFEDLIGLWSSWIPLDGSHFNAVIHPFFVPRSRVMSGAFEVKAVWQWVLAERKEARSISPVQEKVLEFYKLWDEQVPNWGRFPRGHDGPGMTSDRPFFKTMYDMTSSFFEERERDYGDLWHYVTLVGSHLAVNVRCYIEAVENIDTGKVRPMGEDLPNQIMKERAFIYVDNIPKIVDDVIDRYEGFRRLDKHEVEDAWWMLMARMQAASESELSRTTELMI